MMHNRRNHRTRSGKLSRLVFMATLIAILVLAFACGDDAAVTEKKAEAGKGEAEQKTDEKAKEEAPVLEKDYVYTSIGKRDPFRSIFDDVGGEALARSFGEFPPLPPWSQPPMETLTW